MSSPSLSFSAASSSASTSITTTSTLPQGQALQLYNTELVQALRELKDKRDALSQQIRMEEETRIQLQHEAAAIGARLQRIDGSLHEKIQTRNVYDRTIGETEAAYRKILESSQTLLHVLKRESGHLLRSGSSSKEGFGQQQPMAGSRMGVDGNGSMAN
ncbi:sjoegren syndrome nuclear autoantigen 1 homolog [Nannochloropsis oceanica]